MSYTPLRQEPESRIDDNAEFAMLYEKGGPVAEYVQDLSDPERARLAQVLNLIDRHPVALRRIENLDAAKAAINAVCKGKDDVTAAVRAALDNLIG